MAPRRMVRLRWSRAAWGLALALVAASCSDDGAAGGAADDDAGGHRVAVDEEALRPPGTELAEGVVVQEGSHLVATTFPWTDPYAEAQDLPAELGWQAVVVVDGDPVDVWEAYATELGIADRASAVAACTVTALPEAATGEAPAVAARERLLNEPALEGEDLLQCGASIGGTELTLAVGSTCAATDLERCETRSVSHLFLRVPTVEPADVRLGGDSLGTDIARLDRTDGDSSFDDDASVHPPELEVDADASTLPGPGDFLDDELDPFFHFDGRHDPIATMPDGAASLVAPTIRMIDCNSGLVAVLGMPGDPAAAVAAFDGADDLDAPITTVEGTDAADRAWIAGEITTAGGYYLAGTAVADGAGEGTSAVLLTECGD